MQFYGAMWESRWQAAQIYDPAAAYQPVAAAAAAAAAFQPAALAAASFSPQLQQHVAPAPAPESAAAPPARPFRNEPVRVNFRSHGCTFRGCSFQVPASFRNEPLHPRAWPPRC